MNNEIGLQLGRAFNKALDQRLKRGVDLFERIGELLLAEIKHEIGEKAKRADCDVMAEFTTTGLAELYSKEINSVLDDQSGKMNNWGKYKPDIYQSASEYIGLFLKKDVYSRLSTGIAIAGYGVKESFPSLFVFYTEGVIAGR